VPAVKLASLASITLFGALGVALGGACHKDAPRASAQVTPEYKQDITNLCDVLHLSGADQLPADSRTPTIAMWLGPHITTPAGHEFLVKIQPLEGMTKAAALDDEAKRVGLDGCALADEWRR
jgi:predicted metalloprotease with PDZ domain